MISSLKHFRVDTTLEDRITVWIDVAERPVNVLFEGVFDELDFLLDYFTRIKSVRPLLFRSGKPSGFVVGADLRRLLAIESDTEVQAFLLRGQNALSRLEAYSGNTIAVIHGACLGGGLEFAMACGYRIAYDSSKTQLGMPETKLGLMPGWGGTQRIIEMVGVKKGLEMLVEGNSIACDRALEIHLVDALLDPEGSEAGITAFVSTLASREKGSLDSACRQKTLNRCEELKEWRNSYFVDLTASQSAVFNAVETGLLKSRESGFQVERESFFSLLCNPSARESLHRFAGGTKKRD
jgi:3-hydroxyacyl-CoA dehydrogenase/enoyl-CoA hydratase/3-hydroxybutyryl-CoA epimerase